jgi:hypothetical protein
VRTPYPGSNRILRLSSINTLYTFRTLLRDTKPERPESGSRLPLHSETLPVPDLPAISPTHDTSTSRQVSFSHSSSPLLSVTCHRAGLSAQRVLLCGVPPSVQTCLEN